MRESLGSSPETTFISKFYIDLALFAILPVDHELLPWSKINPAKGRRSDSYLALREGYIYRTDLDMLLTPYPKFKDIDL